MLLDLVGNLWFMKDEDNKFEFNKFRDFVL